MREPGFARHPGSLLLLGLALASFLEVAGQGHGTLTVVRTLIGDNDATTWSIYHNFTLEVRGDTLTGGLAGGRAIIVDGQVCGLSFAPKPPTLSLAAPLPVPDIKLVGLAEVWTYPMLRLDIGGNYSACWCPHGGSPCMPAAGGPLNVVGPIQLVGDGGTPPEQDPRSPSAPYVLDRFLLEVTGFRLEVEHDRIRVVDADVLCGGPGAATSSPAFRGPGVGVAPGTVGSLAAAGEASASLGSPGTVGELADRASSGYLPVLQAALQGGQDSDGNGSSLIWQDLATSTSGTYRVCWCSAVKKDDAGEVTVKTDIFFPPEVEEDVNGTNGSNGTNDSNYSKATSKGSKVSRRLQDARSLLMSFDDGNGTNFTVEPVVPHPCHTDAMFGLDLGNFSVAGPDSLQVLGGEGWDRRKVRVGRDFNLTIRGIGLGNGIHQRLRLVQEPLRCGQPGSSNGTAYLQGTLAEDPQTPGFGEDPHSAQTWGPLSFVRSGTYFACFCSGKRGRTCLEDSDFMVEVGSVVAFWPDVSLQQGVPALPNVVLPNVVLRVLPHVVFDLEILGPELSLADRVRIVELSTVCGQPGSEMNTPQLRGTLADSPELAPLPGSRLGQSLLFPRLRLLTGGVRRVCWCPGSGQGGAAPSDCAKPDDFYAEIGVFPVLKVLDGWSSNCPRAFQPIMVHVAAIGLRPEADRALLLKATEVCGEGVPRVLNPGGELSLLAGFGALVCQQDPNAGSELLERKMVCGGDSSGGAVRTFSPGIYRICICASLPGYDCSRPEHYWTPAGQPFEVASSALAPVAAVSVPPPKILSSQSLAVAASYAPTPLGVNRRLAVAYEDGAIRFWQPGTTSVLAELVGHVGRVESLAWAPDGSWLATGGVDGSLRVWGAAAGLGPNGPGVPPHICPRWAQAWSRPGGHAPDQVWQDIIFGMLLDLIPLNVSEEPYVPLADEPKPDDLIDIGQLTLQRAARQCEKVCETYREKASSFCECGASLECYRLGDCVPKCGLEAYTWPRAHMQRLTAVAVSPDGLWIATSSFDNTVKIWDAGSFLPEPLAVVKVHQRAVLSLAFSPGRGSQGIVLASGGDDDFIPWFRASALVAAGAEKQVAPFQTFREAAALGKNVPLLAVAFSPDGQWFAAASRGGIGALWDVDTLTKVRELKPVIATTSAALYSAAAGLVFSMDGNWLATRGPSSIKMLPLARVKSSLPPPEDVWVPFTGQEMASVVMTWTSVSGPVGNVPQHFVQQHSNGTVMQISFAPCNVTEGCGTYLPSVRLDVRVPFEFVGVKGYFLEYSVGEKLADDCRGGAKQSGWSEANPARAYWTLLGPGQSAEGNDCVRVGPQDDEGARTSLDTCKQACVWNNLCNLINYRESARNCDLRHCHSATSPMLRPNEDVGAYAYIKYEDIDELSGATADGYLMFGAPDDHGEGGVAYPGCGAGPEVPKSGVWITIPETRIPRTRVLRWQVAQSVNTEVMAISEIFLELLRPVDEEYVIADPAASTAIALAHDRLEMVAATASFNGALGVWDGRGYDIPAGVKNEYKLKSMFSFQVSAPGLEDSDRMRIVDADLVYQCGDPYSSMSTKKVQGPGTGERTLGSGGFSEWTGNAALSAGSYRICYCGSRGVCCNTNSDFATELLSFVVSGAASDHYVVCETSKGSSPTSLIKSCKVQHFRGVGIQEGDMIMIQDGTYCGVTDGPIPGLPNNGVMISRVPQPRDFSGVQLSGTWYQLERENLPKDPGLYDALPLMPATGMMAKLCWCAKLSGCSPDKPEGFASNSGIIALVKVEQEISAACYQKGPCSATIDLTLVTPISAGDVLVVKTGDEPNQRLACGGQIVAEIGPLQDGYSGRMTVSGNIGTFDLGTVEALISGDFRLCWCQASIRTCLTQEEFSFDLGKLHIQPARYVWPACSIQEINFETWRDWETFDDCCCNYNEAGAVGCKDTLSASFALCSEYPSR